jgi:hypothetical protein
VQRWGEDEFGSRRAASRSQRRTAPERRQSDEFSILRRLTPGLRAALRRTTQSRSRRIAARDEGARAALLARPDHGALGAWIAEHDRP